MECLAQLNELINVLDKFKGLLPIVEEAGRLMSSCFKSGGKLLTCGNGGSAADALHLSEELVGRYIGDRPSLPSICLSSDPSLMTCIGNDYGFDSLFSRQIQGLGTAGDVIILFSSSGNSPNLLKTLEAASQKGLYTIAALGKNGGKCKGLATLEIIVPSDETSRVQEVHGLMIHLWLSIIERELGFSHI